MISLSNSNIATRLENGENVLTNFQVIFTRTGLTIESNNLWEGGIEIDDSVSSDSELQIGTAIINKCTITINNSSGTYNSYDFEGDNFVIACYLINPDNTSEYERIAKGFYIVEEASYTDNLITLNCYDSMFAFDKSYDNASCVYPATLETIVQSACNDVQLVTYGSFDSPLKDIVINRRPKKGTTYREVISWCAQLTGCFARCDNNGRLRIKWFSSTTEANIRSIFSKTLDHHTYTITGVRGVYRQYAEDQEAVYGNQTSAVPVIEAVSDEALATMQEKDIESAYREVFCGTEGYVVEIKENEFLTSENVHAVVYGLKNKLNGFPVKKVSVSHISNILLEAGDYVNIYDTKHSSMIPVHITGIRYTSGGVQTLTSSGEGSVVSATVGNSVTTKNYISLSNRATQIEHNIAREYSKTATYSDGDYVTYNNLIYKRIEENSSSQEDDDDDDIADWENDVQNTNGTNSSSEASTRSVVEADSNDNSNGSQSGDFDPSKWEKVVLTDELFFGLAKKIARQYVQDTDYEKGDYVYYDKNFYVAKEDISQSGTFDQSKWEQIILSDYFGKSKGWWIGSDVDYDELSNYDEDVIYFVFADEE